MKLRLLCFAALLLGYFPSMAWNVLGHRAVAKIAENHLTIRARQEVTRLLGAESLPVVSTWADDQRDAPGKQGTATWHFVNAPAGLDRAQYEGLLHDAGTQQTLYTELPRLIKELQNPATPVAQKAEALKYIVHLVGDAHQPLHAGRLADQGGNLVPVNYRKQYTNLHSLWDLDLVEYPGLTYTEMAVAYDNVTPEQQAQWQKDPVESWLFESYQLSTSLYEDAAKNPNFPTDYYGRYVETVQQRIAKAGIRLAGVLNAAFA